MQAIRQGLSGDYSGTINPYGDGESAARIKRRLKDVAMPESLLKKTFNVMVFAP
jgi:hypothetical protein